VGTAHPTNTCKLLLTNLLDLERHMPDRIMIDMFTLKSLSSVEDLKLHLDLLESSSNLKPTHWGKDEKPSSRRKYKRDELLFSLEDGGAFDALHLYRNKEPLYTLFFLPRPHYTLSTPVSFVPPSAIHWSFEKNVRTFSPDVVKEIFEVSSHLADQVEAIFGYIWTPWDDNEGYKLYMSRSLIKASDVQSYGANPTQIRTWYGPHIVGLIGRNTLTESGAFIRDTSWGGVELDLVEEPWDSSLEEVLKRQKEVMAVLGKTEVFGDYARYPICEPGKKWIPFSTRPSL